MCETGRPIISIVLLVLMLTCSIYTNKTEEKAFPEELDLRYTSYEDISSNQAFHVFSHKDIVGFVQLTVDTSRNQLLVGARGVIFQLSLDDLSSIETTEWKSDNFTKELCQSRGQKESDCYNFIKILLLYNDQIFVCGTNAFKPKCTWRWAYNLTNITETIDSAVGYCPFSPHHNSTGIITSDRDYISATSIDIAERDPAIYRIYGEKQLRTLSNSKWLNEPDFVSTYEIGDFVYFFYREVATEYINCGKRIYSRVARICKSDKGGGKFLLRENWTTFFKARLNCSIPGDYPFYFDELQSTFLLQSENQTLVYGIFATPDNSLAGSAVCVYNLTAFETSFTGPFKYQENARAAWERHTNKDPLFKCPQQSSTNKRSKDDSTLRAEAQQMLNAEKYQMMDLAVQPHTESPSLLGRTERWTQIIADRVVGKNGVYVVLYIATMDGKIRKMLNLPNKTEPCLIEEFKVVPNGAHKPIRQMTISKTNGYLYVSTVNNIISIPLQRCHRFSNADLCINSMDPYCGWSEGEKRCMPAPNGDPSHIFWEQSMNSCPDPYYPVDGKWSEWSSWSVCPQAGNDPSSGDCQCRSRSCDNPSPLYGGLPCKGSTVQVANCTSHGQWTEWSSWSTCSSTCGPNGTQTRSRSCSDPPPRFGGRSCPGLPNDERYCLGSLPCPEPPVDGNWSQWTPWSVCTARCNGGIQVRRRTCSNPVPRRGGLPCSGNEKEWRMCNTYKCKDEHRLTQWTPWSNYNQTANGRFEQRYRFMCTASVPDANFIKSSHIKTHTRFCPRNDPNQKCYRPDKLYNVSLDGLWSSWNEWSGCTADCGTGTQLRSRSCDSPMPVGFGQDCKGPSVEFRKCNENLCVGSWGKWSTFSPCSVTCGEGQQTRIRDCKIPRVGDNSSNLILCSGIIEETEKCSMPACNETDMWEEWSSWTECTPDNTQFRHRKCSQIICHGQDVQIQSCFYIGQGTTLEFSSFRKRRYYTLIHLTVVGCAAFFMGVVICVGIYLCFHNWKSIRKYDLKKSTEKNQNQYETKRYGSFASSYEKRKYGSFASNLSIDFLTLNNRIYDSCTLSSRGTAVIRDGTFKKDKYKNISENTYATIRTNLSLRTEV